MEIITILTCSHISGLDKSAYNAETMLSNLYPNTPTNPCSVYNGKVVGTSGFYTSNIPYDKFIIEARKIYKNYPEILKALGI